MKYLLGIVLIAFIAIAGLLWLGTQGASATLTATLPEAIIRVLSPGVTHNTQSVTLEAVVVAGDLIRTDTTGRAIIQSDLQIISSLDSNTTVEYSAEAGQTVVSLETGRLWSRVERTLEQDESYEIYTPTTVAAVRGTAFDTIVTDAGERLVVGEGVVATYERDPATGAPLSETEVLVLAGQVLEVQAGTRTVRQATVADYDDWYTEHMADDWPYGGSKTLEVTTAHRAGFLKSAAGTVTVVGRGFNRITSVLIDDTPVELHRVSDRELRIPMLQLIQHRDTGEVWVHYDQDQKSAGYELFTGSWEEVRANLEL